MERRKRIWRANPHELCQAVGFAPDPWQLDVLHSIKHPSPDQRGSTTLLACGRQVGKSTITALAIVRALLHRDALVLCCSPSERQSKLIYSRVLRFWKALGRVVPATVVNRLSLELANGATLVVLPGSEETIRGYSGVSLLCLDEAAGVSDSLYSALLPMLSVSGGSLIALGTPRGQIGWFYEAFAGSGSADHSIARFHIPSSQCPRITPAFLEQEKRRLGPWWFAQEMGAVFQETESSAFAMADLDAMRDTSMIVDTALWAP